MVLPIIRKHVLLLIMFNSYVFRQIRLSLILQIRHLVIIHQLLVMALLMVLNLCVAEDLPITVSNSLMFTLISWVANSSAAFLLHCLETRWHRVLCYLSSRVRLSLPLYKVLIQICPTFCFCLADTRG